MNNKTIDYYDKHAKVYFDGTVNADMTGSYEHFLKYLPDDAYILDAGCGSGRDSRSFIDKGYSVKAIDGSREMCELASEYLEQDVENIRFEDLDYSEEFDGIWACASLLHVDKKDISQVIDRLKRALKNDGVLYASFKYGVGDRDLEERYFNDLNEESIRRIFCDLEIMEIWLNDDVRPDRYEKWINIIAKK